MRTILILLCCVVAPLFAQNGDRPGEVQVAPFKPEEIPPAPVLSPEESLKTFKLQPGFKIELVATEPLVQDPVAMAFHPNGSIYVVEMRAYMPDVDGKGEDQKTGRVSILTDTDGDGKMDKSTIFLDGLALPRAICLAYDGVLVAEPPNVWFCRDTNGDGVSDEKTLAITNYGTQRAVEHTANGLMWGLDNWIYSANYTNRIRRVNEAWIAEPSAAISGRGQWGLSQDDMGRLISNSNADHLRGDLVPSELLFRNPNNPSPFGLNVQFDRNQETFPIRMNPGVNRGYQKGQLRADGTLATFTAACGPLIYRGDQFDSKYYGMAFICEPAGNFVRASRITEKEGILTATNAFPGAEFLASTEERFRPVNLYNGPDGALYVLDMHHGVLQHKIYVTTYLRNQMLSRGLDNPVNFGRIYRVVQESKPRRKIQSIASLKSVDLVDQLQNANGWHRDTAQRLLVERADSTTIEPLKVAARSASDGAAIHSLWTLHGMGSLDSQTIIDAIHSKNSRTRTMAIRLAGERASTDANLRAALIEAAKDADFLVELYATYGLSALTNNAEATTALAEIIEKRANAQLFPDAAISGLRDREAAFAQLLLARPAWKEKKPGYDKFLASLARAVTFSQKADAINTVLELAVADKSWHRDALIDGIVNANPVASSRRRPAPRARPIRLAAEPPALVALRKESGLAQKIAAVEARLVWPGKPGAEEPAARPLTAAEKEQFDLGKSTYLLTCAACHQPHGLGQEGLAPPLVDSEWVTGSEQRLALIVLQGVKGPMTTNGKTINLEMPPLGVLEDAQISAILTYIRREWNHTAAPVTTESITKLRAEYNEREGPWTEADLLKLK